MDVNVALLRTRLREAREQGSMRVRRITRPTLACGLLLAVAPPVTFQAASTGKPPEHLLWVLISLRILAGFVLLLAVTPLQPRTVRRVAVVVSAFAVGSAYPIYTVTLPKHLHIFQGGCVDDEFPEKRCAYHLTLFILRGLIGPVNIAASAYLLFRTCRPASVFQRVEAMWFVFAVSLSLASITSFFAMATGTYTSNHGLAFQGEPAGVAMLVISLLALSKDTRQRVQGWLASIGGEVSVAVTVSTMFAGGSRTARTDMDMLALTKATLRAVSAADVASTAFTGAVVDADALAASVTARFGEIDAFVSHSWWDDPSEQFEAFQAWRAEFKRRNKREPTIWMDKYCLHPDNIAQSLPCLPLYVSACRELVLLRGPTVLSRMWCIIELFMFLVMRGNANDISVIPFGGVPNLEGIEATPENASFVDIFLARGDGRFDARRATCIYASDHIFLSAVMDAYPGGIHRFNRELLAALVLGEKRWEQRGPSVEGSGRNLFVRPHSIAARQPVASEMAPHVAAIEPAEPMGVRTTLRNETHSSSQAGPGRVVPI